LTAVRSIVLILVFTALLPDAALPQRRVTAVSSTEDGAARITFSDGSKTAIPKEPGQVSITNARIGANGTIGWLVEFSEDGVDYPVAEELVLWRAGKLVRRFPNQPFYSWTFYSQGTRVAYHVGPLHTELRSHCELRDVASGRIIAQWDGELDSAANRPAWTQGLEH
jgi:hypothetical protein